jgi:hypothetical protein
VDGGQAAAPAKSTFAHPNPRAGGGASGAGGAAPPRADEASSFGFDRVERLLFRSLSPDLIIE